MNLKPSRAPAAAAIALACSLAWPASAAPPVVSAEPDRAPANSLVVTAQRPREQTLIDRKVYTISKDLLSTSGTAADILNNVPSVEVDADGNVSLRGDANVTILIDGKPSAQFSGATKGLSLQQFPADDIDRVEVLTNPPASFKAEGSAGVINIVTKKTRKAGFSGGGQLSLGDKRRYVAGFNGAYNAGKLSLSGGVTLRQDAKQRRTTTDRATTEPTATDPATNQIVLSKELIDEQFRRLIPLVKAGLDYQLNDRQSVSLSMSHRELSGDRYFDQHDQSSGVTGPLTSISDRHSDGHEWSLDGGENLRFEQKLWRPGETLTLSLQRSVTRERERYAYHNTYALPAATPSFDHLRLNLDLVTTEASADYELPLSAERNLKLGYDFEDNNNAFDNRGDNVDPVTGQLIDNPNITNYFRYKRQINAAYGEYQTPLGEWNLQSGLRLEQTDVATLQITGNVPGESHYFRAYPSLNLDRSLSGAAKLSLSISRRVNQPDPEALNPFTDYQDTHNLRAGNANLLPQDTWSYQVGYNDTFKALNYGLTGYVRFNRDSVTDVTQVISADVVLVTKENLPKDRAAGMEFSANGKLTRQLTYSASGNLFYDQIFYTQLDATALGAAALKSTVGLNVKASLDYKPTGADTLQVSFSRSDRRLTPQGYVSAINLVNLGYRRQLRPDLSAVVTLSDALDGQRFQRIVTTPALNDDYVRHQLGQVAYVGLVYTFGAGAKKAKPSSFEYDQ
ncbi:MAG TPA: TonB-dependent receptor [Caulobacteraceae bacterium]|jgi:outer membrane receptor for ferrienterochelin and colicin